jgi:integrase
MAARLFARVHETQRDAGGKATDIYPWVPVEFNAKNGQPLEVKNATSYFIRLTLDGQRKIKSAGKTLREAVTELNKWKAAADGSIPSVEVAKFEAADRKRIGVLMEEFKAEQETLGKAQNTRIAYAKCLENFLAFCPRPYVDQISRKDIMNFILWLRANLNKQGTGDQNSTVNNYLTRLRTFIKWAGVKEFPLPQREWPRAVEKNPQKYSLDVVIKMREVATEDEKDLIDFFLYTGFRKGEVMHSKYSDVDFQAGTINVHAKPEYGWMSKSRKQRDLNIPLPAKLIKRLHDRQRRHEADTNSLIFPNGKGRPDFDLLAEVRDVAKRAKIQGYIGLHKFRATFATSIAKKFDLTTAQQLLSHADIKTTMRYIAADGMNTPESKQQIENVWAGVGD